MSTFDSTKNALPDIIKKITEGKIQLPDFQRGWVWNNDHVLSLLVSIARSFPVGAVMLLETGGEIRFQVRPIENLTFNGKVPEPDLLILDGQQRLTSLTQVLTLDTPVQTFNENGKKIERFYYIDINAALESDTFEDVFISVDSDKKIKSNFGRNVDLDLSTPEKECEAFYFPCNKILRDDEWAEKLLEYAPEKVLNYMKFKTKVISAFSHYQLPIISLGKTTSKEAVCLVFEKVNTGGVSLSVFELITASFAAEGFNLRDDWYGSKLRDVEGRVERIKSESILSTVESTDFLQAISLLRTREKRIKDMADGKTSNAISAISAKRAALLSMSLADYQQWANQVEKGFLLVAKFLRKEHFFKSVDLPYRTQLVPLAAVLSMLKERWLEPQIHEKLCKWFWCGVFGELYGGAVETRIVNDFDELLAWIDGKGDEPRTIYEASFSTNRLNTLRSRNSAAYKGLNTLILREGAKDFFWKDTVTNLDYEEVAIDIHHIFPKNWCEKEGIKPSVFNSIINKTPISYKANRMIGAKAPSVYLAMIQSHKQVRLDDDQMNGILLSHCIDSVSLRADDFNVFYEQRKESLLTIVEKVMDKKIDRGINAVNDELESEEEMMEEDV
jgi:hypothetical protein